VDSLPAGAQRPGWIQAAAGLGRIQAAASVGVWTPAWMRCAAGWWASSRMEKIIKFIRF